MNYCYKSRNINVIIVYNSKRSKIMFVVSKTTASAGNKNEVSIVRKH